MTKHRQIFKQMLEENRERFTSFQKIHDQYVLDPKTFQEQFNQAGKPIVALIKQYEDRLCQHSEKGVYGQFSATLADKFWELVRKEFPKIDFVGVRLSVPEPSASPDSDFEIKKISLS